VRSFGERGFVLNSLAPLTDSAPEWPEGLQFMSGATWDAARHLPADIARAAVEINSMPSHTLLGCHLNGWERWFR
jgi:predicted membrane-bound spermidine synthase